MPKNKRPGGILGDLDYGWEGTTLNERIQAQNQWDLLEAQEESNRIAKQRIEEDRLNAERIAEATRRAEEDRYENELELENLKYEHELEMEKMRQQHENEMRYNKLCDDLGIDYQELKSFQQILEYGSTSVEVIQETREMIEEYEETINLTKQKLKMYKSNLSKNTTDKNYEVKISNVEDLVNALDKISDESYTQIEELKDKISSNELHIDLKNDAIKEQYDLDFIVIVFMLNVPLAIWVLYELFLSEEHADLTELSIFILILFNIVCYVYSKMSKMLTKQQLQKEVKHLKQQNEKKVSEIDKLLIEKIAYCNAIIKFYQKEITSAKKHLETIDTIMFKVADDFFNFRISYYNEEMELLFNKLDFKHLKKLEKSLEAKYGGSIEELKKKDGTIKDYIKYIRNTLKMFNANEDE